MALSNPRTLYGIHEVVLYKRDSGLPYGTLRVLAGSTLSLSGELVQLTGGSSPYAWEAQDGNITAEMSLKPKELPNFLFKVLLGRDPTEVLGDTGNVTDLTNVLGSSVADPSTGILGLIAITLTDLKFGKYIVKVVSPTTVDVYALSSVDFLRGTDKNYVDDLLKITDTPLTITAGATTIPGFGIDMAGGAGTIGMTPGDTAEFEVNPPSIEQMDVDIGALGSCVPEFGAFVTAQKKSDGSMWVFDCFRVKAFGFPFGMEEKAFNEAEITATLLYDSEKNKVLRARYLKPTTGCS